MESVKQAAVADRLVLTKTDLADTPERRDGHGDAARAPQARSTRRRRCSMPPPAKRRRTRLLDCGLYDPARKIPDVRRWLADEAYADARQPRHHAP